jgi:predicted tellurium resistance membrane protein TerC
MLQLDSLLSAQGLISLLTLSLLEIVLGIDNVIFISIIAGKLPKNQQKKARTIGLMLALIIRVALLFAISWIVGLTKPLFTAFGFGVTLRDIILFSGGIFLLAKSTTELFEKVENPHGDDENNKKALSLKMAIMQIVLLDIVFSFDSILTAVGLVDQVAIMIMAVVISLIIMLIFSEAVSNFINSHPSVKVLALSFLIMIGTLLILDAFHQEVPKGYVYFSLAFSLFVEIINLRLKKKSVGKS